ncbi:Kelch motif [Leishmania braziliensis]|nr:Kelch motif [Leishmania braziliensis]
MSSASLPPPQRGDAVQVQFVNTDGSTIAQRPIPIEELLQQQDHTMDISDGIALRLEALNAEQDYSDDDSSASDGTADDKEGTEGAGARGQAVAAATPPPGTRATRDWYEVLDALRREQLDVRRAMTGVEEAMRKPSEGEGRLVTRHSKKPRCVATPLKRFSIAPSTEGKSIAADAAPRSVPPPGASRREVWASLAPAKDVYPHNYKVLRYVSYMPALDCRRFRPTALAFHAAASYLNRKDSGQRLLVYGGVSFGTRSVEQELYEFSVLTGNWCRIEGRQLVPAGHYGHTMTVVECFDRLVVVGGIGPGGATVSPKTRQAWSTDPLRAPRYRYLCPLLHRPAGKVANMLARAGGTAAPLPPTPSPPSIGFVSLLFDMNLSDQSWRAIQPPTPFPLVFHTSVYFGTELFIFGGLTADLHVSWQLLAINPGTYAVRRIQTSASPPRRGRRGMAPGDEGVEQERSGSDVDVDETDGPGPRFLHTAVRYGQYMIVYGGYGTQNEVLDDCWAFDMANERWEQLRCRGGAAGRAGHACCVVGCRMLVTGGFESSLDEIGTSTSPVTTVMELNLVPTVQGEHMWRAEVRVQPPLPPLAFTQCAPCGDGYSFLLFGGLTKPARHPTRSLSVGKRSASTKRRAAAFSEDESDAEDVAESVVEADHRSASREVSERGASVAARNGLWKRFAPFDDGLVLTFPEKRRHSVGAKNGPVVNALGVEVDPEELPEHFKAFVRRQEDFVKKKDATTAETMRKTTLEELEEMEPALYLTDAEIELLMHRSEECCIAFSERYKMNMLPSNVPDREERVHLIEECISESRQVRDVMRSMKGSTPGVTAVKSKTHRKRTGQKFEDYSAAKPFRRVVVMQLITSINNHLSRMYRLNKTLRTVDWPEKKGFLEAIDDMQNSVHAVSRAINGVLNKYIQHRVESLMKGVEKHKEVMRMLTEVVEKNRHDKIWGIEEARNEKRKEQQRARAAVGPLGHPVLTVKQAPSQRRMSSSAARSRSSSPAAIRNRSTPSCSLGVGYHADESKAVAYVVDREWHDLLRRTSMVEKCAGRLRRYCEEGAATSGTALPPSPPSVKDPLLTHLASPQAPSVMTQVPPPLQVPPLGSVDPIAPSVLLPTGVPLAGLVTSEAPGAPLALASASTMGEAGAARPREIMIQRSNELRVTAAGVAEEVRKAAVSLRTALTQVAAETPLAMWAAVSLSSKISHLTAAPLQTTVGTDAVTHTIPVPQLPVPTVVSSHTAAAPTASGTALAARSAPSDTSSSSSLGSSRSSSSSSGSSAPAAPAATHGPSPQLLSGGSLPSATTTQPTSPGYVPPPVTVPVMPNAEAASAKVQQPDLPLVAQSSHNAAADSSHPSHNAKDTAGSPAQTSTAQRHAVHLNALRPLLAARESLLQFQDKVILIRLNKWDTSDLAGPPQDMKVEELYKRLSKLLTGVTQCITASFLTKAGARPPRLRPAPLSVGPPPPPSRSKKAATERGTSGVITKRSSQSKSLTSTAAARASSTPAVFSEMSFSAAGDNEGGSRKDHSPAEGALHGTAEGSVRDTLRLKPLPLPSYDQDASAGDEWLTRLSRPTDNGAAGVPLVSNEALLRNVRSEVAPAALSSTDTAALAAMQVHAVYPGARTIPNTNAASVVCGSVAAPMITGPWAPTVPSMQTGGSAFVGAAAPAVSLSVVPKVLLPAGANGVCTDKAGAAFTTQSSLQRRRSTIADLTQLRHPFQNRLSSGNFGDGTTNIGDGKEPVTREPATSVTRGNFVVNTEYLSRAAPHALLAAPTAEDQLQESASGVQLAWADVDEDYFYFGRAVEKRTTPAAAVVSGPPYLFTRPSVGVGVSPPVGSVVGSPRANAEWVVPPTRDITSVTSVSAAPRTRSSTARRSISSRRVSDHYLLSTASQSLKSHTARPVVRKEGAKHNFYTPGELQLMHARERLRSKPSK